MAERVTITVNGLVQGVGFRWHARRQATQLGLDGTVRNLPDGKVHIVVEGERVALERFLAWTRRGPSRAEVRGVEAAWGEAEGRFGGFTIIG